MLAALSNRMLQTLIQNLSHAKEAICNTRKNTSQNDSTSSETFRQGFVFVLTYLMTRQPFNRQNHERWIMFSHFALNQENSSVTYIPQHFQSIPSSWSSLLLADFFRAPWTFGGKIPFAWCPLWLYTEIALSRAAHLLLTEKRGLADKVIAFESYGSNLLRIGCVERVWSRNLS